MSDQTPYNRWPRLEGRFRSGQMFQSENLETFEIFKLRKVKNASFELISRDSVLISNSFEQNGNPPKPCRVIRDEMGIR